MDASVSNVGVSLLSKDTWTCGPGKPEIGRRLLTLTLTPQMETRKLPGPYMCSVAECLYTDMTRVYLRTKQTEFQVDNLGDAIFSIELEGTPTYSLT